jgi:hypothetical protein
VDRNYILRSPCCARAWSSPVARFRNADFIYARLFDVALLALFENGGLLEKLRQLLFARLLRENTHGRDLPLAGKRA